MRVAIWLAITASACGIEESGPAGDVLFDGELGELVFDVTIIRCEVSCDDGDPCTDDDCDTSVGTCTHLPRNILGACRSDAHCDDGTDCTTDTCVMDECGLQRCENVPTGACRACSDAETCIDADVCTADLCRDGFCVHVAGAFCGDGCNPAVAVPEGQQRLHSVVSADETCCGCSGSAHFDAYTLSHDGEPATCTVTCDDTPATRCTPMDGDMRWTALGVVSDGVFEATSWCTDPQALLDPHTWRATIQVPQGTDRILFQSEAGRFDVIDIECVSCPFHITSTSFFLEDATTYPLRFRLLFALDGVVRDGLARVFPTATGFDGTFHSNNESGVAAVDGTIHIERIRP